MIQVRKKYPAFARGTLPLSESSNIKIFPYLRIDQEQIRLVVNHLSRFVQPVELPLSQYQG